MSLSVDRDHLCKPHAVNYRRWLNATVSITVVGITIALAPRTLLGLTIACTLAVCLEVIRPLHEQPRRSVSSLLTDLTHAIGNRYLVIPLVLGGLMMIEPVLAWLIPRDIVKSFNALPLWAQIALLFVLSDFLNYWAHRSLHCIPFLWRFHKVHHSTEQLDWIATSRVHPLDLVYNQIIITLPYVAFVTRGSLNAVWLGALQFVYPFLLHTNARLPLPWLEQVFVSPALHHWHHADHPEALNKNFGTSLAIWDKLFGSFYLPGHYPSRYGVGDTALAHGDYLSHMLFPLTASAGANNHDDIAPKPDDDNTSLQSPA